MAVSATLYWDRLTKTTVGIRYLVEEGTNYLTHDEDVGFVGCC